MEFQQNISQSLPEWQRPIFLPETKCEWKRITQTQKFIYANANKVLLIRCLSLTIT